MNEIFLNFIPFVNQNQNEFIYRKLVKDSSQTKQGEDFRARLPEIDDGDWKNYDISIVEKNGYEKYEYNFALNSYLSIHIIYKKLLEISGVKLEQRPSKNDIFVKKVHFTIKVFKEGKYEIIVQPYFLKSKNIYGFLFNHKFNKNEEQEFNRNTQILSLSLDRSGKPNIYFYKDKKEKIREFVDNTFYGLLQGTNLMLESDFIGCSYDSLRIKQYIVGDRNISNSQFMGIKSKGPFRKVDENVRYLFVFSKETQQLARHIYLGLSGKLFPGQFSGINKMFFLSINKNCVEHCIVDKFDRNAINDVEGKILKLKSEFPDDKIMMIAVLPKGFKGVDSAFDAYGYLKLMALNKDIFCQVITEDTFFKKDQLKWSISNIGLQIFSKLGGAPWLVKPAKTDCLIFGIGSVQEKINDNIIKYTAYTVCLDSSGDFRYIRPLSSSDSESSYLQALKSNLEQTLSSELERSYKSLVLHLPYKITKNEILIIKEVVSSISMSEDFEIIVVRINTKHKFLGFSNHNTCVPYESTYVQLSKNEFLLWTEGLQHGKEVLHKRVSEPLYIDFLESDGTWNTKKDCLQDILNLTGANWRGFNSKAQPISILYSRLIAKFMKDFSHLENVSDLSIVSADSIAPWFL